MGIFSFGCNGNSWCCVQRNCYVCLLRSNETLSYKKALTNKAAPNTIKRMEHIFKDPEPHVNGMSPWGGIQEIKELAPGIIRVYTASHGGIWVDFQHEKKIPSRLRNIARQYAPSQWYEEDCDALIVGFVFQAELMAAHPKFVEVAKNYISTNERYKDAVAQSMLRNVGNKL